MEISKFGEDSEIEPKLLLEAMNEHKVNTRGSNSKINRFKY